MKKILIFPLLLVFVFISCNKKGENSTESNAAFQKLSEEYQKGYLDWRPQAGVQLGLHEYDGKINDFSKSSIAAEVSRLKDYDAQFSKIDTASLNK